jgi:hypothetical protein
MDTTVQNCTKSRAYVHEQLLQRSDRSRERLGEWSDRATFMATKTSVTGQDHNPIPVNRTTGIDRNAPIHNLKSRASHLSLIFIQKSLNYTYIDAIHILMLSKSQRELLLAA